MNEKEQVQTPPAEVQVAAGTCGALGKGSTGSDGPGTVEASAPGKPARMLEPPSAAAGTGEVEARLDSIDRRIEAFADTLTTLVRQQELIQGAVRQLGSRVTEAATSLSAPRVRELYGRLVLLYDLVAPTPAHLSPDAAEVCQVVATQIEQFLEVTGFQRIPTDGAPFNRDLHKPVRVVRAENPEVGGRIVATVRNGFCSELGVLRPAEVVLAVAESATLQAQTSDQASALGS